MFPKCLYFSGCRPSSSMFGFSENHFSFSLSPTTFPTMKIAGVPRFCFLTSSMKLSRVPVISLWLYLVPFSIAAIFVSVGHPAFSSESMILFIYVRLRRRRLE
jgi:hypothetical protein